jgi:hypothetical protein
MVAAHVGVIGEAGHAQGAAPPGTAQVLDLDFEVLGVAAGHVPVELDAVGELGQERLGEAQRYRPAPVGRQRSR